MGESTKWTPEAEAKLKDIPFFVRPFARKKIEKYAQDNNLSPITIEIYDQAKKMFNKKFNEMN
jgi:hypothetical protein